MATHSKIYGRNAKLYGTNLSEITVQNAIDAFKSAILIKEISIGFPVKDGDGYLGDQNYLYRDGEFDNSTAQAWDEYASTWQLMPIFFIDGGYDGKVDFYSAYKLFPYAFSAPLFNTYYVTDDDLDYVQFITVGAHRYNNGFVKSTKALNSNIRYLNYAIFGTEVHPNYIWCNLNFINQITPTIHCDVKTSISYSIPEMANSWWMQRSQLDTTYDGISGFQEDYVPMRGSSDPYNQGGISQGGQANGGGGTGTFSRTGDLIGVPNLPTLSAVDAGFITLFNPSISELRSLAAYMWSDAFSIDTFKKIFANPMDCILGMSIVPVNVPNGSSKEVKVGNIGTGVSMTTAASQYVAVDCGTLNVEEYWGAYLDYDPYTKAEIYLPYIGTHPVAIDDVMGKSVHVVYHIDILSGACIAFIQCGGTVIYSFAGQCASSIPITGNDWTNVINGVLQIAGAIGSMVATPTFSNITRNVTNVASSVVSGSKPQVEKSGSLGGTGGMLGVQTPYLIITWPRQAVPYRQNAFKGYPSNITASLGSLTGFTVVDSIHLENVPATGEELDEIMNLLREGVIL